MRRKIIGAALFVLSGLISVISLIILKYSFSLGMKVLDMIFLRACVLFLFAMPLSIKSNFIFLRSQNVTLGVVRDIVAAIALFLWYGYSVMIPVNDAVLISFVTPVLLSLMGGFALKEGFNFKVAISLILCFSGVLIAIKPDFSNLSLAYIFVLLGAIMRAVVGFTAKILTGKIGHVNSFLANSFFSPFILFFMFSGDGLSIEILPILIVLTFLYACYLWCFNASLHFADVSFLQPFDFSRLIFATVISAAVFEEYISLQTIFGAIIILASYFILFLKLKKSK